jgi:predicted AAA+ superfamily ATPase
MVDRLLLPILKDSLKSFPVCGLIGSRQAGKSTLARTIASEYGEHTIFLDLELPSDLQKLADPELYFNQHSNDLIIIDEIQRMPEIFPLIRSVVDKWSRNGCFLILGSASPDLIRQSSESLAGRILYTELSPFLMKEVGINTQTINSLWLRGGYPRSFLASNEKQSIQWRASFRRMYLERDIPQLGIRVPAATLDRFWQMLAHYHGQLWNASTIAQSLGVSPPTSRHYLDILEDTFVIRQLAPYYHNGGKRLVKSPKIYIRDSGLLHMLLRIETIEDLFAFPGVGASWEGFVIEQIINACPFQSGQFYFYRTSAGAEIDLLYFRKTYEPPIAIEIKFSAAPAVSRGFREGMKDLECKRGYVLYPGQDSYPISKEVTVLPVSQIDTIFS